MQNSSYNLQHRQPDLDAQLHAMSEQGPLEYEYLVHWTKTRNVVWNPEKDSEALAKCVEADPGDRRSRLALAEGLWRLDRPQDALEVLAPLADSDPEARPIRALIALDRGDEAGLDRWLAAAPVDDPQMAVLRGKIALKDGHPTEAVPFFRIAHAANPADRLLLFALGNALRQSGNPSAAEPYLLAAKKADAITPLVAKAALRSGKLDPTLPARIGAACAEAGRVLEATAWYRLAVARDPLDRKAQEGLAELTSRPAIAGRDPKKIPPSGRDSAAD